MSWKEAERYNQITYQFDYRPGSSILAEVNFIMGPTYRLWDYLPTYDENHCRELCSSALALVTGLRTARRRAGFSAPDAKELFFRQMVVHCKAPALFYAYDSPMVQAFAESLYVEFLTLRMIGNEPALGRWLDASIHPRLVQVVHEEAWSTLHDLERG